MATAKANADGGGCLLMLALLSVFIVLCISSCQPAMETWTRGDGTHCVAYKGHLECEAKP